MSTPKSGWKRWMKNVTPCPPLSLSDTQKENRQKKKNRKKNKFVLIVRYNWAMIIENLWKDSLSLSPPRDIRSDSLTGARVGSGRLDFASWRSWSWSWKKLLSLDSSRSSQIRVVSLRKWAAPDRRRAKKTVSSLLNSRSFRFNFWFRFQFWKWSRLMRVLSLTEVGWVKVMRSRCVLCWNWFRVLLMVLILVEKVGDLYQFENFWKVEGVALRGLGFDLGRNVYIDHQPGNCLIQAVL